jgi:hypothetical protein
MKNIILKYGAIGGAAIVLFVAVTQAYELVYREGITQYIGYLGLIIMPLTLFFGLKELRDKYAGGSLSYGKAVLAGLGISIFAALLYCVYTYIDYKFLGDKDVQSLIKYTTEEMRRAGNTPAEINSKVEKIHKHYGSVRPYISNLVWYTGLGFIYSTVIYFLLKIKPKP